MTNSDRIELRTFESEVRQLLKSHKSLKSELKNLRRELSLKESEISSLETELRNMRRMYSTLKTAKMLEVSDSDVKESKLRITRLVREVNKCIRLLSAEKIDDETSVNEVKANEVSKDFTGFGEEESSGIKGKEVIEGKDNYEPVANQFGPKDINDESVSEVLEEVELQNEASIQEDLKESIHEADSPIDESSFTDKETDKPTGASILSDNAKESGDIGVEDSVTRDKDKENANAIESKTDLDTSKNDIPVITNEPSNDSSTSSKKSDAPSAKSKDIDPWDFGMLPLFTDDEF